MSSLLLSRGWLRFYSIAVEDHYIAHQFCFEYGNRMFLLQEGFAPEWAEHGVGNVLRAYVLRDCIERKVASYDFLGGVTEHKLSWGAGIKKSLRVAVGARNVKNGFVFVLSQGIQLVKKCLKTVLPERLLAWGRAVKRSAASRRQ